VNAKAKQKERTRQAILDAAARALRGGGIARSTVGDVMKAAGLTVGGFYAHFRSKQDLLQQAMRTTSGQLWSRLLTRVEAEHVPADRAIAMVEAYLSESHRDDLQEGCLLPATVADISREGRSYRAVLSSTIDGFATELGRLLGGGPTARARALGLIALMYGGLSMARALGKSTLSSELLAAARAAARAALARRRAL
jgi:TetR/AcrR family transcriptional regulator, transcriptional repressor for nem operon